MKTAVRYSVEEVIQQVEENEDDGNRTWSSIDSDVHVNPFTTPVGPTIIIQDNLFLEFFSNELISLIVTETNRYAKQCLESRQDDDENELQWETNEEEIKAYIGFTLLMGLNRVSDLYDYWSTNTVFHYFPIASRISRKRFLEVKRYLHFVDNTKLIPHGKDGYDKLGKIKPVIEAVREKSIKNFMPHRESSIDEAMIRFKGRSSLKQYLPMKPIKRGIKVWVRADSHNGYISEFYIYKDNIITQNLGEKVVEKLSRTLVGGNYHLYFDNYFTSVELLEKLLDDGIYACGTFRKDRRRVPFEMKNVKLGNICVCDSKETERERKGDGGDGG